MMDKMYLLVVMLLFSEAVNAGNVFSMPGPKGRLLTVEEGCGYSKVANSKIVGGGPAKRGAYPWMALLGYQNDDDPELYNFNCGGTLITSRHVLTAAHCINYTTLELVRLGEHDLSEETDGRDFLIKDIQEHEDYDEYDHRNDIAIITLDHDVTFNDRIRPICLPVDGLIQSKNFVGSQPFAAGWGAIQENGTSSDVLLHIQVPVLNNEVCHDAFEKEGELVHRYQFDDTVLCAGHLNGGKDSCQGDSGGPLMLPIFEGEGRFPFYQIGVVSYGIGCGMSGIPGVYVNIPYFAEWIKEKLE